MALNLSGRSFLTLLDFTTEEIEYMLELSRDFKNLKRMGAPHRYLEGKNIVLLFEKTSTRTRCAFEVGGMDLGLGVTYFDPGSSQMGKRSPLRIPPACLVACTTVSSIVALTSPLLRSLPIKPAFPCGMVSPMSITRPRLWRISLRCARNSVTRVAQADLSRQGTGQCKRFPHGDLRQARHQLLLLWAEGIR